MVDPHLYQSTIGALQYMTITRLDLAYIVSKVSQFLQALKDVHWQACKRVLQYLKNTATYGVSFQKSLAKTPDLQGYSDADWASFPDDRRSTGAYCVYLGSCLISWSSKKQTVVAHSSIESEYRTLAHVATEVIWLKGLLKEMHVANVPTKGLSVERFFTFRDKLQVVVSPFRLRGNVEKPLDS
ncbi:secreted RxLR effector protein 161-like [Humulus lupulus]|uniref:secreted RxLR effector protein 161-like n=1 Tax=Humulus lupulus TaxID=3486 RepID=UPI002B4065E3|nr:secreted RxLR effector protein 161-like [Humulus lupulus]